MFRSYNTTLKAILALPDPRDRSTYPSVPYPVGSEVYALYPDTTSFYKARVVGTPTQNKVRPAQRVSECLGLFIRLTALHNSDKLSNTS